MIKRQKFLCEPRVIYSKANLPPPITQSKTKTNSFHNFSHFPFPSFPLVLFPLQPHLANFWPLSGLAANPFFRRRPNHLSNPHLQVRLICSQRDQIWAIICHLGKFFGLHQNFSGILLSGFWLGWVMPPPLPRRV